MIPKPPKILDWPKSQSLPQRYKTSKSKLLASGCSFTANTAWLHGPASWPGYVRDFCGFDYAVDLSYPGVGNEYIASSVLHWLETNAIIEQDLMVLICWTGLNRLEIIKNRKDNDTSVFVEDWSFGRFGQSDVLGDACPDDQVAGEVFKSWKNIISLHHYLSNRNILHGFTTYVNLLKPPYLPKRDLTPHFTDYLSKKEIKSLLKCPWIIDHEKSLFEFCFSHDHLLESDLFHPACEGVEKWTKEVLLPSMHQMNMINEV